MNLFPFLRARCLRVVLTRWWLWYIGCCGRAESVRVCDGDCGLVGGAPGCGPGVAGSSHVGRPVVSHGVVMVGCRKTPNLDRLVWFGVFRCYRGQKCTLGEGVGYSLTPGLYDTSRRAFNRAVGDVLVPERTKRSRRRPLACALLPRGIEGRHPPLQLPAS